MDLRFVNKSIFNISCDCMVYFTTNDLLGRESDALIKNAGEEILYSLSEINGLSTGDSQIIPGKDLLCDYVIVSCIPKEINDENKRYLFEEALYSIFDILEEYQLNRLAMDIEYIKRIYGNHYVEILNRIIQENRFNYSNVILYLCQNTD
ncbi:MAG: macro domain-containing protein [Tissierellia bacterium]|nr:macro domain-containing protein [Tissierellia bacterium]